MPMTDEELHDVNLKLDEALMNGDDEEVRRLMKTIRLPPSQAKKFKKQYGAQWLLDQGWDLSEAEAAFGSNWLTEEDDDESDSVENLTFDSPELVARITGDPKSFTGRPSFGSGTDFGFKWLGIAERVNDMVQQSQCFSPEFSVPDQNGIGSYLDYPDPNSEMSLRLGVVEVDGWPSNQVPPPEAVV